MKVLGISCSMRKGGNSEVLVSEALAAAAKCGAETELITLAEKRISPCEGCYACAKTGECRIQDDVQPIHRSMLGADGIIFATPVYFFFAAGQTKTLLDRCHALYINSRLANKVGGIISVASSMGNTGVWHQFNAFFSTNHMLAADLVYGYGRNRGEVKKDRHAMQAARELGREVVLLIQKNFRYPEQYDAAIYRLLIRDQGIDTCPSRGRFENTAE